MNVVQNMCDVKKIGLAIIIENLKTQQERTKDTSPSLDLLNYGENSTEAALQPSVSTKLKKRHQSPRPTNGAAPVSMDFAINNNHITNNNNNNVKNERLSPGTPEMGSRSITPSSYPNTPPSIEQTLISGRNYSDIMRSLAARYQQANPNDTQKNGFPPPPPLDPRFKSHFPSLLPQLPKEETKKPDLSAMLNPFVGSTMFPPLIDMSSTQALLAVVRQAKEAELQSLLKAVKRQDASSPLDLSAAAPAAKKPRFAKAPSTSSSSGSPGLVVKRSVSESPQMMEDVSHWSVDDVCVFVGGIDICAEYVQTFREQQIDGSGLPLLTEEHLTTTMGMKLGPALKLRSILAKKLGSCSVCLHCTHCHTSSTPEPGNSAGNISDSGGVS